MINLRRGSHFPFRPGEYIIIHSFSLLSITTTFSAYFETTCLVRRGIGTAASVEILFFRHRTRLKQLIAKECLLGQQLTIR